MATKTIRLPFYSKAKNIKKAWAVTERLILPFIGALIFILIWYLISSSIAKQLPSPISAFNTLYELIKNPFYDNGPNDKGIGWQILYSFKRVFLGFFIGSFIAIPLGTFIGLSKKLSIMFNPIVQILRPVSPLAWFPIGLAIFQASNEASIFTIAITSLWPTLINTVYGVSSIPEDYKSVAKVFGFSKYTYIRYVALPYALSFMLTGLKISIGIAWMVIVASEMLAGGTGIGFYIWDSWNSLNLNKVISAILAIGIIGYILDRIFEKLQRRFAV
jgi:nitrate/nitrite transport system permease protein